MANGLAEILCIQQVSPADLCLKDLSDNFHDFNKKISTLTNKIYDTTRRAFVTI